MSRSSILRRFRVSWREDFEGTLDLAILTSFPQIVAVVTYEVLSVLMLWSDTGGESVVPGTYGIVSPRSYGDAIRDPNSIIVVGLVEGGERVGRYYP